VLPVTKAGRYELSEELGRGAMGVVYKAHDPVIGRTVAVKTLRLSEEGTGMTHEELISRFQTEARAAGLLSHPNIVVVYDAGEEEGLFYITMEYVEGRSLQALLDSRQAFPLPRVMRVMEHACSALEFAHQHNVVHRDIKPANLMLAPDDTLKITDFGTAKILQFGTAMTQQVIGTPSYMSPEQVKGRRVDGRSDIFSLGVILYELVTGEKPFPGRNITTVIYKIVNEDPIPPRELDSTIHPGLSNVITRALAKEPGARYQSCREMMDALRRYREVGTGAESTLALPGPARADQRRLSTESERMRSILRPAGRAALEVEPSAERPRGGFWLALILLLVIGGAGYYVWPYLQDIWERGRGTLKTSAPTQGAATQTTPTPPVSEQSEPVATPETKAEPASPRSAEPAQEQPVPAQPSARELGTKAEEKPRPAERPTVGVSLLPAMRREAQLEALVSRRLGEAGLGDKVKVQVAGTTVTLSGLLTPSEHRRLLEGLSAAPALQKGLIRVVDHIEYATAPEEPDSSAGASTAATSGQNPADAETAAIVRVISQPPLATIFVNGQRYDEPTPTTLRLPPGQYSIVLRKPGFQAYDGVVQIQQDERTQLNVQLTPLPNRAPQKRPIKP